MSNQIFIPNEDEKSGNPKGLSIDIDQDRLKYFFYMMNGEPSSRIETFGGAVSVSKADIEVLVNSLIDKLKLAHIRDYVIKIGVGFDKTIVEKSYDDFLNYSWSESSKTKEIIIKINCMYEDYDTGNPLNHSMFIRIARKMNSGNVFQVLASSDLSKMDEFDQLLSPVFCRTDYLDDELSKSLMGAVSEWHKGQKQPPIISKTFSFSKKYRNAISKTIHYLFPFSSALVISISGFILHEMILENSYYNPAFLSLLMIGIFSNTFFSNHGRGRASKIYKSLSEITNQDVIFDVTRGDDKENAERINENKEAFSSAKFTFIWSVFQAVGASLIAAAIFQLVAGSANA